MFTIDRTTLAAALSKAASVCKDRSVHKPILANVLLSVADNRLAIAGTDLERYVKAEIECDGDNCQLTVNASRLSAIVRAATDDTMKFTPTKSGVEIVCGRARWNVQTENAQDFPQAPTLDDAASFAIGCNAFTGGIRRVAFSVSREANSRYSLGAILVEGRASNLAFAATDGRRLTVCQVKSGSKDFDALLPLAGAQAMQKNLPDGGECIVSIDRTWVAAVADGLEVYAKQNEGRFPSWRDVFPEANGCHVDVPVAPFLQSTLQTLITTSEESIGATISLGDGEIKMQSKAEAGNSFSDFPVAYNGDPVSVSLDASFLAEALRAIEEETVEFHCFKDKALFVWGDCKHVIMGLA